MKKVLVTGAGGFIGSHLCEYLVRKGYKVRALVRYTSTNTWGWLDESPLKKEIEVITGDLRDYDSVSRAIGGVQQVYHLGALIGIPYSYESPLAYIKTNVEGTYNILEASRRANLERVLVTSTSEVYGTAQFVPISEKHPLQPQSPYSASKIAADNLALSYYLSFNTPVVVARPFNTYGPRQSARAIIPTIITQLLSGYEKIHLGSLDPTRDLTLAEDTASGMWTIAEHDGFLGQAVNIGVGDTISIGDLYQKICKIVGRDVPVTQDEQRVRPKNSEVMRLMSDNSLLRGATGWKPSYTLDQGLEKTVEWFKSNLGRYKAHIYNV